MARAVYGLNSQKSNPAPSGIPQGTPGGKGIGMAGIGLSSSGRRPGMKLTFGDEGYLWILLAIELILTAMLRKKFRRYHGG